MKEKNGEIGKYYQLSLTIRLIQRMTRLVQQFGLWSSRSWSTVTMSKRSCNWLSIKISAALFSCAVILRLNPTRTELGLREGERGCMAESYGKGEGAGEGCASSSAQSAGAIYSQEAINYLFQTKIGKEDVIQMRKKKKKK